MPIVRFWRSTRDVQIFAASGFPIIGTFSACVTSGGLYQCSSFDSAGTLITCAKPQRSESVVVMAET